MQTRTREPELMDDPALDARSHLKARRGLARLNALSGAAHALWRPISRLAAEKGLSAIKVLDIATGSADVPLRLWRIARRHNLPMQIDGCDFSQTALERAQAAARRCGASANFFKLDVFADAIPSGYDVVMTCLFTHHLSDQETIALLRAMAQATRHLLIVSDLQRSPLNHALVWFATRLVSTSPIVHFDGPASVRNSFTPDELLNLAKAAGLEGAIVEEIFPCRMILRWSKS